MANKVSVDLDARVSGFVQGMNQAEQSAAAYETETQKISESTISLNKELRKAQKHAKDLAGSYAALSKEAKNSQFGIEMKRQLDEAINEAGRLLDVNEDVSKQIKALASDTRGLDVLTDTFSGIGHTISAANGVVGIFTGNTKQMKVAITAFTTAESIATGVSKVYNLVKKDGALMTNLATMKTKLNTIAERQNTAAVAANTAVMKAATVAAAALSVAMKAIPYIAVASALYSIASALGIFGSSTEDATEKSNVFNDTLDTMDRRVRSISSSMSNLIDYMKQIGSSDSVIQDLEIEQRRKEYEALIEERKKYYGETGSTFAQALGQMRMYTTTAEQAAEMDKKIAEARERLVEAENKRYINQMTGSRFEETWSTLNTAKEIRAAISYFNNLKDEAAAGSQEFNTYADRVAKLEANLNKITGKGGKGGKSGGTIKAPKLEEPKSLLDNLNEQLKKAEKSLEFTLPGSVEETFIKKIILDLKTKIENETKRLKIEPKEIDLTEILKIKEEALAEKIKPMFDFSSLPKEFEGPADKLLDKFNQLEEGKKALDKIINGGKSTPEQIQAAIEATAELNAEQEKLKEGLNTYQSLSDVTKSFNEELAKTENVLNSIGSAVRAASSAFGALGDAFNDKGLKAAGIIAEAIATIALSYAQAAKSAAETPGTGWVQWLAFSLSGLGTMATMISQIKSLTSGYANGGIIEGNSFSGDNLLIRANSGEMMLNQRQQRNLFNMIDTNSMSKETNVHVTGVIRGTDLLLVQRNTNKILDRTGNKISIN